MAELTQIKTVDSINLSKPRKSSYGLDNHSFIDDKPNGKIKHTVNVSCCTSCKHVRVIITQTRPCNIQHYSTAVKMLIFR